MSRPVCQPLSQFTLLLHPAASLCCLTVLPHCAHTPIHPSIDLQLAVVAVFLGTQGTNVCPAGSVSVGTEVECRSAATALGYTFDSVFSDDIMPKGCFFYPVNGRVYFNEDQTGSTIANRTPICAGACSGPHSFVYACECTCACMCHSAATVGTTFVLPFFCHS